MTKHEHPPFRMVIEGGKLVPATAYDAERLDSYRRGTAVRVVFTEEKDRPMVRKWWAILGRAIKECKTPWQNKEQASEAIKLALGIVNLSKTVNGAWLQYPKSLTELSDPEVTDAVERMIDVIYHVTGVDASVWRKHVENIRDEEPADVSSIGGQGSDGPQPSPDATTVAADQSGPEDGGPAPAGEIEAQEEPGASSAGNLITRGKLEECRDKFLRIAADSSINADERRQTAKVALDAWRNELPGHHSFVEACLEALGRVIKSGKPETEKNERVYLDGLIERASS